VRRNGYVRKKIRKGQPTVTSARFPDLWGVRLECAPILRVVWQRPSWRAVPGCGAHARWYGVGGVGRLRHSRSSVRTVPGMPYPCRDVRPVESGESGAQSSLCACDIVAPACEAAGQDSSTPALVAQRIEHLTTDRFSILAVLTCENRDRLSTVCTESDA